MRRSRASGPGTNGRRWTTSADGKGGAPQRPRLPEGVYYRVRVLWVRLSVNGEELREPTEARTPREASRLRGVLDAVLTDYEVNGYSSLGTARTARQSVSAWAVRSLLSR